MSLFGENLQKLLSLRRSSVRELAEGVGIPAKTLQEWIGPGGRSPRKLEQFRLLASFLDCSVHFLLFGEEDPKAATFSTPIPTGRIELEGAIYEITLRKLS